MTRPLFCLLTENCGASWLRNQKAWLARSSNCRLGLHSRRSRRGVNTVKRARPAGTTAFGLAQGSGLILKCSGMVSIQIYLVVWDFREKHGMLYYSHISNDISGI